MTTLQTIRRHGRQGQDDPDEEIAAFLDRLERAGLAESRLRSGRKEFRSTEDGRRILRSLSMVEAEAADDLLDAVIDSRSHEPTGCGPHQENER